MGFNAFLDKYLDSLLTNGRAVGEIVRTGGGREIAAVLCHRVEQLALREGETALDVRFCGYDVAGRLRELPRQELVLFTPAAAGVGESLGVSLLRSDALYGGAALAHLPMRWGRTGSACGNVRFAVVYKPQGEEPDGALARERAELLAQEWSGAMQETRGGSVRDFVSVGDVSIRAIGADNVMPDCEVPVRQILEQLVAKTGLPPFLLGLSWSSTERMSSQQRICSRARSRRCGARSRRWWSACAACGCACMATAAALPWSGTTSICRTLWRRPRRSCTASRRAGSDWKMTRGKNRLERERKGSGHRRDGGGAGAHQPLCEEGAAREGGLPFAVKLCDNEVDRDFERFDRAALEKLSELFVGRTGIFDHSWSAGGQTARIYRAEVIEEETRHDRRATNTAGARAGPICCARRKMRKLIAEIEGGIKKEVSVGCSAAKRSCSICGKDAGLCEHEAGEILRRKAVLRGAQRHHGRL